jgi:hypothetical protein
VTRYIETPYDHEQRECRRFYQKTFEDVTAPAQNVGVARSAVFTRVLAGAAAQIYSRPLPVKMRAVPTATLYNPSAANALAREVEAAADAGATSYSTWGEEEIVINITAPAGGAVGDKFALHYQLDAEL